MPRYTTKLETEKPPEEVFDYVADFANAAQWDPNVKHAERTAEGPIGETSEFRLDYAMLGSRRRLLYRITAFTRPHEVVLQCETASMSLTDRITVVAQDAGSCLTYDAKVTLRGPLKLVAPLFDRGFQRAGDRARAGLCDALRAQ